MAELKDYMPVRFSRLDELPTREELAGLSDEELFQETSSVTHAVFQYRDRESDGFGNEAPVLGARNLQPHAVELLFRRAAVTTDEGLNV